MQEALVAAHLTWPRDGIPDNPRAWLVTAATRRLVDEQRSTATRRRREQDWAATQPVGAEAVQLDDSLTVLLMCCHPVLSPASAVALTLRAVGGLTTAEIAAAYVVPQPTMAQRISRAKRTLVTSGTTFELPPSDELGDRVRRALAVIYLLYNEGYAASAGADLTRTDRSAEAIRLGRLVHRLLPDDPETTALLALMLLLDARRPARVTASGELVTLAEQDRSRWDRSLVAEGTALLHSTIGTGRGPGRVPGAGRHRRGARPGGDRRRHRLATGARALRDARRGGSEPVRHARARGGPRRVGGPGCRGAGARRARLVLGDHQRRHAVRGHVAELRGDREVARRHYLAAATRATNLAEQRHLTRLAAGLSDPPD